MPISILYLCHCIINIIEGKKMFANMKLTKRIWRRFIIAFIVSCFSAYTIYSLLLSYGIFVKSLVISFIISFNLITYIAILSYETKLFNILRAAFFYSVVYFYKTVVIIFVFMLISIKVWEYYPVLFIVGVIGLYLYIFIKVNLRTLLNLDRNGFKPSRT